MSPEPMSAEERDVIDMLLRDGPFADDLADYDEAEERAYSIDTPANVQLLDPLPEETNR